MKEELAFFLKKIVWCLFTLERERERERQSMSEGEAGKEGDTQSEAGSRL